MEKALDLEKTDIGALILGAFAKVREDVEEAIDEIIRKGEERAKELKDDFLAKEEEEEEEGVRGKVSKLQKELFSRLGLSTYDDLKEIEERIENLSAQVEKGTRARRAKKRKK